MNYKWEEIDLFKWNFDPFNQIANTWFLIGSKSAERSNMMTANWGQLGYLWKKPVFTIYVRPQRFSEKMLHNSEYFSVSFVENHRDALVFLGRESGRDYENKIKAAGLTEISIQNQPAVEEANIVLICKKLYRGHLEKENFTDFQLAEARYPEHDYSYEYTGEIIGAYKKVEV